MELFENAARAGVILMQGTHHITNSLTGCRRNYYVLTNCHVFSLNPMAWRMSLKSRPSTNSSIQSGKGFRDDINANLKHFPNKVRLHGDRFIRSQEKGA